MNCGRKAAKKDQALGVGDSDQEALVEHPQRPDLMQASSLRPGGYDGGWRAPYAHPEINEVGSADPFGDGEGLLRGCEQGTHASKGRCDQEEKTKSPAQHHVDGRPEAE